MTSLSHPVRHLNEAAPAICLAVLLILPVVLPNRTTFDPGILSRRSEVAEAMNDLPYSLGSWVGTDIEVPAAAVKLLHPNAILSRRYERIPSGPVVNVLLVHCSDARDMIGHYPPVCYPSAGWTQVDGRDGTQVAVRVGGEPARMRLYEFKRIVGHGVEGGIRIISVFVLPDGTLTPEMDDIYLQSERLALTVQGAAQLQVITSRELPVHDSIAAAEEILDGMRDLFAAFGVGGTNEEP